MMLKYIESTVIMPGLNTSDPSGRALLLDLAFQPTLVALAGVDDQHNDDKSLRENSHNCEFYFNIHFYLSGTPPECQNCKEEVNCSESKGDKPPSGGESAGGGGGVGSGGGVGGGGEPCAYECTARGGCTVRYTGPPRGGPSSGNRSKSFSFIVHISHLIRDVDT